MRMTLGRFGYCTIGSEIDNHRRPRRSQMRLLKEPWLMPWTATGAKKHAHEAAASGLTSDGALETALQA
jgi:hypothetical protein